MLMYGTDMDTFLGQFKEMILSIVVKQNVKAAVYETAEMKAEADKYVETYYGLKEWEFFSRFHRDTLAAAGVPDSLINDYIANKELIPFEIRNTVMTLERAYIIDNYTEKNNYYRLLAGLPSVEDEEANDFVYVHENNIGVSTTIPIHKLSEYQTDKFVNSLYYKQVIDANPDKEYLKFLGVRKVPPYKARKAANYEILYVEKMNNAGNAEFFKNYANARNYVMKGIYNNEDRKHYQDYDSFMGFLILTMAINRTFAALYKQGMTRTFYDDNLIRDLFQCYNIPYQDSIEVKFQRILAKRLNILLSKKASNNVFYDIADLFEYSGVDIYSYYLMKDYHKDNHGNPIINYKTIVDEEGNSKEVIDPETTYDIYFQRVNIRSKDPAAELADPSNRVEYDSLTYPDPYWVNDHDLLNKLYESRFNYIITKYMSLDIAFDLTQMTYETAHAVRLMLDVVPATKEIKIELPWVEEPVSLYDATLFLNALMCKKCYLTGEIPLDPEQILTVYGFDFRTDIEAIRDEILEHIESQSGEYSNVNPEIIGYLKSVSLLKPVYYVHNFFKNEDNRTTVINEVTEIHPDYETEITRIMENAVDTILINSKSSEDPSEFNENIMTVVKDPDTADAIARSVSLEIPEELVRTLVNDVLDQIVQDINAKSHMIQEGDFTEIPPSEIAYEPINSATSLDDIRRMYEDIEALRLFLDEEMRYTNDVKAYEAYQKLYDTLLVTNDIGTMYTKKDGEIASTFDDLLQDRRPDLYEVLQNTEPGHPEVLPEESEDIPEIIGADDINNKINKILSCLGDVSDELKDIEYANEKSQIVTNIEKVINQFKSYTVDLTESGLMYKIIDPHMCMLKIIDSLATIDQEYEPSSKETKMLIDDTMSLIKLLMHKERLGLRSHDEIFMHYRILIKDIIKLLDRILNIYVEITGGTKVDLYDTLGIITDRFHLDEDSIGMDDSDIDITSERDVKDWLNISDKLYWGIEAAEKLKSILHVIDTVSLRVGFVYLHALRIYEQLITEYRVFMKEHIKLDEIFEFESMSYDIDEKFDLYEILVSFEKNRVTRTNVNIKDDVDITAREIPSETHYRTSDSLLIGETDITDPITQKVSLIQAISMQGNNILYSNVSFKDSLTITRSE